MGDSNIQTKLAAAVVMAILKNSFQRYFESRDTDEANLTDSLDKLVEAFKERISEGFSDLDIIGHFLREEGINPDSYVEHYGVPKTTCTGLTVCSFISQFALGGWTYRGESIRLSDNLYILKCAHVWQRHSAVVAIFDDWTSHTGTSAARKGIYKSWFLTSGDQHLVFKALYDCISSGRKVGWCSGLSCVNCAAQAAKNRGISIIIN